MYFVFMLRKFDSKKNWNVRIPIGDFGIIMLSNNPKHVELQEDYDYRSSPVLHGNPTISGYLWKYSEDYCFCRPVWKRRFCVVQGGYLFKFASQQVSLIWRNFMIDNVIENRRCQRTSYRNCFMWYWKNELFPWQKEYILFIFD